MHNTITLGPQGEERTHTRQYSNTHEHLGGMMKCTEPLLQKGGHFDYVDLHIRHRGISARYPDMTEYDLPLAMVRN